MMALLVVCAFALFCAAQAAQITISNVIPRRDTSGAILDAHDSKLNLYNGLYYWHAASYGNCTEPKGPSGCNPASVGACGFQVDHNVTLYTSPDLVTWTNQGAVFGAKGNLPPNSVLFAPKTVYNARTKMWVLWFNYIVESFSNSFYGVAVAPTPTGPFTLVNREPNTLSPPSPPFSLFLTGPSRLLPPPHTHTPRAANVALQFQDNGDEGLFVDEDGAAYVIYTTLSKGHSISIERLTENYTASLGAAASSGIFGESFVEAPALFKRNSVYYATFGHCCCYCGSGSPVSVYTAASPLGPYTKQAGVLGATALPPPALPAPPPPQANGTITLLSATFGASCGVHVDLTSAAAGACNGAANCSWAVCLCGTATCPAGTPGCIADPAYGCAKDLSVRWACSGDAPTAPPRAAYTPPEANGVWAGVSCFPPPPPQPLPFGSQQTDIFSYVDSAGQAQYMYVGDHWQSAPDGLKSHDFTVWAPLVFAADGNVSSPGFLPNFTVDVGVQRI